MGGRVKIGQICWLIVVKKCQWRGIRVQRKFANVLNGWSLIYTLLSFLMNLFLFQMNNFIILIWHLWHKTPQFCLLQNRLKSRMGHWISATIQLLSGFVEKSTICLFQMGKMKVNHSILPTSVKMQFLTWWGKNFSRTNS